MAKYWVVAAAYQGYDRARDDALEKTVGTGAGGSGFGFGFRDIDWSFDHEANARAAMHRLREAKLDFVFDVTLHEHDTDE